MNRLLFWGLFLLAVFSVSAQQVKYPGDHIDLVPAAEEAEAFCIARFQSFGIQDAGWPGATRFSQAVIEIERNLRDGPFEATTGSFQLQEIPPQLKQVAPKIGQRFLMLGTTGGDFFVITKMVEPTAENIAVVEGVMKARNIPINPHSNPLKAPETPAGSAGNVTSPRPTETPRLATSLMPTPSAASQPTPPVAAVPTRVPNPIPASWPWLIGIAALIAIIALAAKRRR